MLFAAAGLVFTLYWRFTPIIASMAKAGANNAMELILNDAINEKLQNGELSYEKIVNLEKTENGTISALSANVLTLNRIRSDITFEIIKKLPQKIYADISVPIGNLIGSGVFSGKGPMIPVKIVAVSSVNADFKSDFSSEGINHLLHRISILITANVNILLPGRELETPVSLEMPVAETVIIGLVPENFTYFESDEKWDTNDEKYDIMS
jgi:sporulation protein YunB